MIERLEALLASGQDNAMLRFTLARAYLEQDPARSIEHLRRALDMDPEYSAAWRLLGQAQVAAGDAAAARETYRRGVAVAEKRGDMQAMKEMQVFLRRLEKAAREAPDQP